MKLLKRKALGISDSKSRLGFCTKGGTNWPVWDRFITLDGNQLFHIGNVCGTCGFFFRQLREENRSIIVQKKLIEELNTGLLEFDIAVDRLSKLMPIGDYEVAIFNLKPDRIGKGDCTDYFKSDLWESWYHDDEDEDESANLIYYRGESRVINKGEKLFEFVIPLYQPDHLNTNSIEEYKQKIRNGQKVCAVSIGILDVKSSMIYPEVNGEEIEPEFPTHWTFANYLIDGHHKMYAASEIGEAVYLISFISKDNSWKQIPELLKHYE